MIGLALSGGGSRAIAFQLGCLRALHDRAVLPKVGVISCVSGGSVLGALYAYSKDDFITFDAQVCRFLKEGFALRLLLESMNPVSLIRSIGTHIVSGTAALGSRVMGRLTRRNLEPPFQRWFSRTRVFEHVLMNRCFGDLRLGDKRRNDLEIVFNATELRSGSAFRFGSLESGCWRYGKLNDNSQSVAFAVAASAAYPLLLPAIDTTFDFVTERGSTRDRVILTDGGIFENLGVSCLEPDRSASMGVNNFPCEYIISCDAGLGMLSNNFYPYYWFSRVARSFETVYKKLNDGTRRRLHLYKSAGMLKGFVLSYLGQIDEQLPFIPQDLIPRDSVKDFPTDFSAMSEEDIQLLSLRGEQLMRLLLSHYCKEL